MPSETQHWSVSIGVWKGVPVHLHLSLILVAIFLIGCQLGLIEGLAEDSRVVTRGSLSTIVLMLMLGGVVYAVPLFAQLFGIVRPIHAIRRISLQPWGAYFEWQVDTLPQFRARTYSIGILANAGSLAVALLCYSAWLSPNASSAWLSVYPWHPQLLQWSSLEASMLASVVWFNAAMLLARMIPIAPVDFGRLLAEWGQSRFHQVPSIQRSAVLFLVGIMYVVLMVGTSYLVVPEIGDRTYSPGVWPLLGGLTLLFASRREYLRDVHLYLTSKQQRSEFDDQIISSSSDEFAHASAYEIRSVATTDEFELVDLSEPEPPMAWESPDQPDSGWESWMDENRASREEARENHAAAEETLLDQILLKVSAGGIAGLTDQERQILDRVSQIYRRRREIRH